MSRIGKMPINIPESVKIEVSKGNEIKVKGPKGELTENVQPEIKIVINGNVMTVERPTDLKRHKSMHGLYRMLIANMIEGVTNGYKIELEVVGVGYKVNSQGQKLELNIGFSHDIVFIIPQEVKVTTETVKGKPPTIILESHDKQLIGQLAERIRKLRKPEPYKGKGIKYKGEVIRRKAGKAAATEG